MTDLCVEFRLKEIVIGIWYTEMMLREESSGRRAIKRITVLFLWLALYPIGVDWAKLWQDIHRETVVHES